MDLRYHVFLIGDSIPSVRECEDIAVQCDLTVFDPTSSIVSLQSSRRKDALSAYVTSNHEWMQTRPLVYQLLKSSIQERKKDGGFLVRDLPRSVQEADYLCEVFQPFPDNHVCIVLWIDAPNQQGPDAETLSLLEAGGVLKRCSPEDVVAAIKDNKDRAVSFRDYRRKFDNSFMFLPTAPFSHNLVVTEFTSPANALESAIVVQLSLEWAESGRMWRQFCGGHPISLTRDILNDTIVPNAMNYVVSAKLDGARYFLLISDCHMWFVDRNTYVWKGPRHAKLQAFEGTLIDAELCPGQPPALFFIDGVSWKGHSLRRMPLLNRLQSLAPLVEFLKPLAGHFVTVLQTFHPFDTGAAHVAIEQLANEWKQNPLQSPYDGLVFTPKKAPYTLGRSFSLLKWKPPNRNTVDLQVNRPEGNPFVTRVSYSVDRGLQDAGTLVGIPTPDAEPAFYETDSPIVECCAEKIADLVTASSDFVWRFVRIRRDKSEPNVYWVVNRIVEAIKEGITCREMLHLLPGPPVHERLPREQPRRFIPRHRKKRVRK